MIVYRVQDKNGRGPWKPGFSSKWVEDRPDHDNLVPWYVEFGRVDHHAVTGMALGSACITIEQLRRWFTPSEYVTLQELGYKAVKMEADVLAKSQIQCFIQRAKPFKKDVESVNLYES